VVWVCCLESNPGIMVGPWSRQSASFNCNQRLQGCLSRKAVLRALQPTQVVHKNEKGLSYQSRRISATRSQSGNVQVVVFKAHRECRQQAGLRRYRETRCHRERVLKYERVQVKYGRKETFLALETVYSLPSGGSRPLASIGGEAVPSARTQV
jgi:hypothetical protein